MKKQNKNKTVEDLLVINAVLKFLLLDLEESTPKSKRKEYLKPLYLLIEEAKAQLKTAKAIQSDGFDWNEEKFQKLADFFNGFIK